MSQNQINSIKKKIEETPLLNTIHEVYSIKGKSLQNVRLYDWQNTMEMLWTDKTKTRHKLSVIADVIKSSLGKGHYHTEPSRTVKNVHNSWRRVLTYSFALRLSRSVDLTQILTTASLGLEDQQGSESSR